jgi:3-phenylpropionate/trans-cinnamate dioxygenase alpha subunit
VGVPGFKDYYHEDLNRDEWGLIRAAQVESYHGYVFATLDAAAPPL